MQIELGDMIHWQDTDGETDIGWVIHIESHEPNPWCSGNLVYIKWLFGNNTNHMWEQRIIEDDFMKVTKGGQDDQ